ncbi:hypothetical protein ACH5RR_015404 [Cinchona calisaya]|uniref:SWIM-type domain-containing protein n=1 Tax=Cinchona calisaya TaxID=153742 RepID=A0ABD2ZWJ4_9GENT
MMASENMFDLSESEKTHIVNLSDRTCECGVFQLIRLPCKHAASGIVYRREPLEAYCDPWFSMDQYLKTYTAMMLPIPTEKRWPPMLELMPKSFLPPPLRRAPVG